MTGSPVHRNIGLVTFRSPRPRDNYNLFHCAPLSLHPRNPSAAAETEEQGGHLVSMTRCFSPSFMVTFFTMGPPMLDEYGPYREYSGASQ